MAEIEIVYREGYCEFDCANPGYDTQCHTQCAEDMGCPYFSEGEHEDNVIPFGDCVHAHFRTKYKGISAKTYEMEEIEDVYNPHLNCMLVKIGKRIYQCEKVILNGKCIYNILE